MPSIVYEHGRIIKKKKKKGLNFAKECQNMALLVLNILFFFNFFNFNFALNCYNILLLFIKDHLDLSTAMCMFIRKSI